MSAPAQVKHHHPAAPEVVEAGGTGRALVVGGALLGVATLLANGGNYVVNLLLGRWLPPAQFADATLMVTIWLTMSGISLALQLVTARFVGLDPRSAATDALLARLGRLAWLAGLGLAILLAAPSVLWSDVFNTQGPWPFVVLAVGLPFHLALSVGRGTLQGRLDFGWLSLTLLAEMATRVLVTSVAVQLGGGVVGATAGLSTSLVVTWALVRLKASGGGSASLPLSADVRDYARSVAVLLAAQVILSNVDVLSSKIFLHGDDTGRYAAVALIGRGVFFLSWAAATVLFPAVARRHQSGEATGGLLRGGLAAVALLGICCAGGALLLGEPILVLVLGPAYAGLGAPLAVYALSTTCFALANLIATHHLSTGRVVESWVMLGGGVALTLAVAVAHASMATLIGAHLTVMSLLLIAAAVSHLRSGRRAVTSGPSPTPSTSTGSANA